MTEDTRVADSKRNLLLVATGCVLLSVLGTIGVLFWAGWLNVPQANHQAMIHDMSSQVMPFDLSQTTHILK